MGSGSVHVTAHAFHTRGIETDPSTRRADIRVSDAGAANQPVMADLQLRPRALAGRTENRGHWHPAREEPLTDLDEPLEPLESYPDELPPPRQRGDVNLVGLLSIADDLARSLAALKIRVQPHNPKTSLVSAEKARENTEKEVSRLLGTAVYLQRHAHAALLGRCVLGADSKEDCSTEGARLQLNVWDDTTRREIVEDGTTGCVTHTVEAARRTMADPASHKILLAFVHDDEGTAVSHALGLGPDDTEQFLNQGLVLRPKHRVS